MNTSFIILLSVVCLATLPTSITGCSSSDTLNATDTWQMISSSNYPNNYQNNEKRCWNIISSVDNLIFEVVSYDLETGHDYLTIYDVSEDLIITEMARFTGNGVGNEQQTLTTAIRVEFTSDESGTGAGFQLKFKFYTSAVDDDQDTFLYNNGAEKGVSAEARSTTTYLAATSAYNYFSAPVSSLSYEVCYWQISTDLTSETITFARISLQLKGSTDVMVFDGRSTTSRLLEFWTNSYDSVHYRNSTGNHLLVKLSALYWDDNSDRSQFRFGYKISSSNAVISNATISSSSNSTYNNSWLTTVTAIAGIVFGVVFPHIQH